MRLEAKKYVFDVHEAAGLVAGFVAGKSFADYQSEPMLRLAVERAFSIIGEALAQLSREDPAVAAGISDGRSIIAFRNILVHAYANVDDRIVWEIIQYKLPVLVREVAALMDRAASES
jgi:uncharacterized protein with HEPN domain